MSFNQTLFNGLFLLTITNLHTNRVIYLKNRYLISILLNHSQPAALDEPFSARENIIRFDKIHSKFTSLAIVFSIWKTCSAIFFLESNNLGQSQVKTRCQVKTRII